MRELVIITPGLGMLGGHFSWSDFFQVYYHFSDKREFIHNGGYGTGRTET